MMQQEGIPLGVNAEDASLTKAIEASLKVNTQGTYEPLDAESRGKKSGEPIGLKNIGNTCYFNSLMQTLFRVEPFYRDLLLLKDLDKVPIPESETDINKKRYKEAVLMVKALQELFITLTASNQKYTDPSNVLNRCVNDMAEHVKIGDQQDIVEYSVNFFERIEDVVRLVALSSNAPTPMAVEASEPAPMDGDSLQKQTSSYTPKLRTSIGLNESSFIKRLFFGTMVPTVIQGAKEETGSSELFGPILLDPTTNYFYKSWEDHFYNQIENFQNPDGSVADAKKWELVEKFPEVLCFQVNRAKYNKASRRTEKNNQRFEFDPEIYSDRFLLENKQIVKEKRTTATELQSQIDRIEQQLKDIRSYKEGRNILKSFEDVLHYFNQLSSQSDQTSSMVQETLPEQAVAVHEPRPSPAVDSFWSSLDQAAKSKIIEGVDAVTKKIQAEEAELIETKKNLQDQLRNLYKDIEKTKYSIFSIIIHEGTADHGHYYCYIRGAGNNWFRFNDFHVRAAEEKEVFETAFGNDNGHASAYCIFYMKDDIYRETKGHDHNLPADSKNEGYYKFLSNAQMVPVLSANQAFIEQVAEIRVKKVVAEYEKKWDLAKKRFGGNLKSEEIAKKSKVFGIRALPDYIYYLANQKLPDYSNDNQILNYSLLRATIKQLAAKDAAYSVFDIFVKNPVFREELNGLLAKLDGLSKDKKISSYSLESLKMISFCEAESKYLGVVHFTVTFGELIFAALNNKSEAFMALAEHGLVTQVNFHLSRSKNPT